MNTTGCSEDGADQTGYNGFGTAADGSWALVVFVFLVLPLTFCTSVEEGDTGKKSGISARDQEVQQSHTGIPRFEAYSKELREKHGKPEGLVVTVSGLSGVGSSTVADFIADRYELDKIGAGAFFRSEAKKRGMDIYTFREKQDEIEEEEGVNFDLQWDKRALRYGFTRDDLLLEGRLTGALLEGIAPVRVLVICDAKTIARRVSEREDKSYKKALKDIKERNENDIEIFQNKYGVDPRNRKYYTHIIDNSGTLEETRNQIRRKLDPVLD